MSNISDVVHNIIIYANSQLDTLDSNEDALIALSYLKEHVTNYVQCVLTDEYHSDQKFLERMTMQILNSKSFNDLSTKRE